MDAPSQRRGALPVSYWVEGPITTDDVVTLFLIAIGVALILVLVARIVVGDDE